MSQLGQSLGHLGCDTVIANPEHKKTAEQSEEIQLNEWK